MFNLTPIFRRLVDYWRMETILLSLSRIEPQRDIVPKLVPLRVPTGWIVEWNLFYDFEPVLENGILQNTPQCNDSEYLLWLHNYIPDDKKGIWDEASIELGWYETTFRAVLFVTPKGKSEPENERRVPAAKIETTSVRKVQETIDNWLENWHKFLPRS